MTYKAFYETFLAEMPQRANGSNPFNAQAEMIRINLMMGMDAVEVEDNVFKQVDGIRTTYWVGSNDASNVSLVVDTETKGHFKKVALTSKNPDLPKGSPPFASDLYLIICRDSKQNGLVFTSDETVSTQGERLWKGLVRNGNHISVYDADSDKFVLNAVKSEDELDEYLGDSDKKRFVFVLSESHEYGRSFIHHVAIMELKRNCGYPIIEMMTSHLKDA